MTSEDPPQTTDDEEQRKEDERQREKGSPNEGPGLAEHGDVGSGPTTKGHEAIP